jgi:hypothetical protein
MLDCYVNATLEKLVSEQFLDERLKHPLPPLTAQKKAALLQEARALLQESTKGRPDLLTAAEEILLKTFCQYNLAAYTERPLTSYDLLFELFQSSSFKGRQAYWQERLLEVYPCRPMEKSHGSSTAPLALRS